MHMKIEKTPSAKSWGLGTYFGEIALISNFRRTATVQTKNYSNIGLIDQQTVNEIFTIFPDVKTT